MKRTLVLLGVFLILSLAGQCIAQSTSPKVAVQSEPAVRAPIRTIATLGGSPKQCTFAVLPLLQELRSMPYPSDWNFVLICTDAQWDWALQLADIRGTDTAFTVLSKRTTVLRAAIFIRSFERGYKNTLWHELGHIECNCMSEDKANEYAHANAR